MTDETRDALLLAVADVTLALALAATVRNGHEVPPDKLARLAKVKERAQHEHVYPEDRG